MSPKTSQQYEEIRESRKKQIMEVALKLFAESGYTHTSISKIAAEAVISKGLLYNYFESKEDLLIHIMEEGMKDMVHFFDPNRDGVLTREEFIYFIHEVFNLMNNKLLFYKLYFSVMMQPTVMGLFEKRIGEIIQPLLKSLADYYQRKGSENPMAEAILVGAMLDGIGFNYVFNPDLYPIEEVKKLIIERFI